MTLVELSAALASLVDEIEGEPARSRFVLNGVVCHCRVKVDDDRLRIAAPVLEVGRIKPHQRDALLEANFESAGDARYAQREGLVYACYLHSLSALTEAELRSGALQVVNLVLTFGTTYSGGSLVVKKRGW